MTISSPHNDQLKEIRKLAGRKWRDKLREFVAEGEDLLAAADAAGWEPLARPVAGGLGAPGRGGTPAAGRPRRPVPCAWRCGASTIPATSARRCAARSPSAPRAWRSGRAPPT